MGLDIYNGYPVKVAFIGNEVKPKLRPANTPLEEVVCVVIYDNRIHENSAGIHIDSEC